MYTKSLFVTSLMLASFTSMAEAQTNTQAFGVSIINSTYDDNDKVYDPHRAPAHGQPAVSGTYDTASGTLCLSVSFDIACVRIYKDNNLIMEDNYPVMDDGSVYYNLSFYGSGAYRICINDDNGNIYIAYLTI